MAGPNYTIIPHDWVNLENIINDLSSRIIDEDASFSDYILKNGSRAYTATGAGFKDEDDMSSDSAIATASQQSIKAYVDTSVSDVLSELSASLLVATDGDTELVSVDDLTAWIAGTSNQITVTDDTDGSVTLSTPQDIHTGASPTFAGLTLSGLTAGRVPYISTGGLLADSPSLTFSAYNHFQADCIIASTGTNGDLPYSGAGTRFFWLPAKEAIRAGSVTGTDWDNINVGGRTFVFGNDSTAKASNCFVFGSNNDALSEYDFLVGNTLATNTEEGYNFLCGSTISSGNVFNLIYGYAIISGGDYQISFGRSFTPLASDDSFCLGWGQLDYSFTATAANFYNSSLTINSVEVIGADGEVNAAAIEDKFLRNDASDSTSGTITAAGFTTAGIVNAAEAIITDINSNTAQDVKYFEDLPIGAASDGQSVYVYRNADAVGEGKEYLRFYVDSYRIGNVYASRNMYLTANNTVWFRSTTGFIRFTPATNYNAFFDFENNGGLIIRDVNDSNNETFILTREGKARFGDSAAPTNLISLTDDGKIDFRDNAIGMYSQADTFLDIFADGAVRIGDSSGGAPTNYTNISPTGVISFVGTAGLRIPRYTDDVSSPPTDAELDAAIGAPSAVGEGYIAIVDDNDAGANVYLVVSTGTDADKWWIATLTQAA